MYTAPMDDVYAEFGCNSGRLFYEVTVSWIDYESKGGQIGWGTKGAMNCGFDRESIGYSGGGFAVYRGRSVQIGTGSNVGDVITAAIDFEAKRVLFANNGELIGAHKTLTLPDHLSDGKQLYPLVSFKDAQIEFNFGAPRKPCKWLMERGFVSLEQAAKEREDAANTAESVCAVDWHSEGVIDELWLWIFECLTASEVFGAGRVCRKWRNLMAKYNVAERHEMGCYFSKSKLTDNGCTEIMGIGLEIKPNESGFGVSVLSQMDILSKSAWRSGCRIGVWGEKLTHFLPMVMDRKHSERAHKDIVLYLKQISEDIRKHTVISNPNELEKEIANNAMLKLVDSLISMMNSIVVQFVMKNDEEMASLRNRNYYSAMYASKSMTMMLCEKAVIGYSAFHHLLLYLQSKNKKLITSFANRTVALFLEKMADSDKSVCKDLGKLLIYTMISSQYQWADIAKQFVVESMTRNVKWMVTQSKYAHHNTTDFTSTRSKDTFEATRTSRRLIMFQIWFCHNNSSETLYSYNRRLGRPRRSVRDGIILKTKEILQCDSWGRYLSDLGVVIEDQTALDQMLRFAVYNSFKKGYHSQSRSRYSKINLIPAPKIQILSLDEAERANATLFVRPSITTESAGYRPLRVAEEQEIVMNHRVSGWMASRMNSTSTEPTSIEPTSTTSSPQRRRFSLSTIKSLNESMGQQPPSSLSERLRNAVKPSDRFQDDAFSMNWRRGPRPDRTTSDIPFRRPSPRRDAQQESKEEAVAYDSQSTTSVDTVNEVKCAPNSVKPKRKRKRNRNKNKNRSQKAKERKN